MTEKLQDMSVSMEAAILPKQEPDNHDEQGHDGLPGDGDGQLVAGDAT